MDEITTLNDFRRSGGDPAALARARNRLLDHAGAEPAPPPRLTRRRLVAVTAAAGLAAAGLLVADSFTVGDRPLGASAEAADLLRQAADRAIATSDPQVGTDEYLHITTVAVYATYTHDAGWLETYTDELFVPGDPTGDRVTRRSDRVPYRPEDAEAARQAGGGPDPGFTERIPSGRYPNPGGWHDPTPEFLAGLPRDPAQLRDRIYTDSAGAGHSADGEALVYIADLLRSGVVPADLRAALFRTAALIPGVEVTDRQANLNGETGVAVGRYESVDGSRQEIIFDPGTGLMIGEREILVDQGYGPLLPAGAATGWTAVTTDVVPAAEVDAIPPRPQGGESLKGD